MTEEYIQVTLIVNSVQSIKGDITPSQLKRIDDLLKNFIESNIIYEKHIKGKL